MKSPTNADRKETSFTRGKCFVEPKRGLPYPYALLRSIVKNKFWRILIGNGNTEIYMDRIISQISNLGVNCFFRSASFMEMNEKENCLSDISKALEIMDSPDFSYAAELQSVRVKLLERKSRCSDNESEKFWDVNGNERHQYFCLQNPSKFIEAAEDFVEIEV